MRSGPRSTAWAWSLSSAASGRLAGGPGPLPGTAAPPSSARAAPTRSSGTGLAAGPAEYGSRGRRRLSHEPDVALLAFLVRLALRPPCSTASAAGSTTVPSCSSACGYVDADDLVVGGMALPDASAGDHVLAGDLADIFGIEPPLGRRPPAAAGPAAGGPRRTGAPPSGFQPTARRVAELRHPGGFSVPEFPVCSAYPRRRCTAGKRPAGRSPSEPVRRTPCRCCTGNSRNARLSDPARSWPERRGRRAIPPPRERQVPTRAQVIGRSGRRPRTAAVNRCG